MRTASEIEANLNQRREEVEMLYRELREAWLREANCKIKVGDSVQKKTGKREKAIVTEVAALSATWIDIKGSKLKKDGNPSKKTVRLGCLDDIILIES